MIKIENLTKIYGEQLALDNVNLTIESGEFIFLVGASGAGKSTLIKILYREEIPTAGRVSIGKIDIADLEDKQIPNLRRCMGIIFQDYKLLPRLNVYDNVAYVIRTMGMSTKEVDKRVKGALSIVGLSEKLRSKPFELSGGEQQRVSIARAIVNAPPILIADEPTGNLDPQTSFEILEILDRINKRGTTIIMSTHDKIMVDHFKKRVITLDKGRVIKDVYEGSYV